MNTELGAYIRQLRLAKGLTLEEVAAKSGLPWTTIRAIEVGRSLRPRPDTLERLAIALDEQVGVLALKAYGRNFPAVPAGAPTK